MDPDANLREQVELARLILDENPNPDHGHAERLAELVLILDGWIKSGGYLPRDWPRTRGAGRT